MGTRLSILAVTVAVMAVAATPTRGVEAGEGLVCLGVPATIVGTPGIDRIRGTPGDDVIVGGGSGDESAEHGDEIHGRGGDDRICADPDDDLKTLTYGGGGDDQIVATGDLHGGPGDDTLTAPVPRGVVVKLVGGTGNDILRSQATDANIFRPGPGDDRLEGNGREAWNLVFFGRTGPGVIVDLREGTADGQGHDELTGIMFVFGSDSPDLMFGDDRINGFSGQGGNDVLVGRGRRDFLEGNVGDDQLDGGRGSDQLAGGLGRDMLLGHAGNDSLTERRPGANLILAGTGRDHCWGNYRVPPNVERSCESHRRPPWL
ncbi:MAG TPA: calcium-binding protein [Marmoricola sp.]|nr:calcium-binding protein [Marmoricola sp.]